jgi:hypothetical protein
MTSCFTRKTDMPSDETPRGKEPLEPTSPNAQQNVGEIVGINEEPAAWLQDSPEFTDGRLLLMEVLKDIRTHDLIGGRRC